MAAPKIPDAIPEAPNKVAIWNDDLDFNLRLTDESIIDLQDDDLDSELPYPTRVSLDCLWEVTVFLTFVKEWQMLLVVLTIVVYIITTYEIVFDLEDVPRRQGFKHIKAFNDVVYIIDTCSSIAHWRLEGIRNRRDLQPKSICSIRVDVVCIIVDICLRAAIETGKIPIYNSILLLLAPVIRMYRPITYFKNLVDSVGSMAIVVTLTTYSVIFIVTLHTYACCWYLLGNCNYCGRSWTTQVDENMKALDTSVKWVLYIVSLYHTTCVITSTGFGEITPQNPFERMYSVMMMMTGFALLVCAFIGSLTSAQLEAFRRDSEFRTRMQLVTDSMVDVSSSLKRSVMDFYLSFWKYKRAVGSSVLFDGLPLTMQKEIQLDRYYLSVTKSIILRGLTPAYLRDVSLKMHTELYTVNDVIYKKEALIDRLIYVIRGNINILSPDDNETPILTLTAGTVMGDAALILSLQSKSEVCAATACEVQVIYRCDLYQHWSAFHNVYVEMHRRLKDRLNYTKQRITKIKAKEDKRKKDIEAVYKTSSPRRPLKILKNRLRRREKEGHHSLIQPTIFPFRQLFNPVEIDEMYILAKQEAVTRYDICIKSECPWILTPNTLFLTLWQFLIFVVVLLVAYLYPYYVGFQRKTPDDPTVWSFTVIVDILFILDIYIQLSTAVDLDQDILIHIRKIALVKLKEFRFILDIIAVLPSQRLSYYLQMYSDPRIANIFFLNRLAKVHVMYTVFTNLEHSMKIDFKPVRMFKYLLFLVTGAYWIGTIYYMGACFDIECRESSWYMSVKQRLPQSRLWHDHILSFYFAMDVISQTGYGDLRVSDVYELIPMCFSLLIGALLFSWLVSDYSATLMLSTLDKVAYKEIVFVMKKFMEENKISQVIQARVYVYLDLQWYTDQGYNIMQMTPLLADLPPQLAKNLQVAVKGDTLRSVPILQELSDETIAALAALAETYVLPPGEVVSYAGEVCREFYVIEDGYCEAIAALSRRETTTLGRLDYFGIMEMLLERPGMQSVRSVTHVKLIRISKNSLHKVFSFDPEVHKYLLGLVKAVRHLALIRKMKYTQSVGESQLLETHSPPSWIKFVIRHKHTINFDYSQPFDDLGVFKFIRYGLMTRTIIPNGPFMECWEKGRAVCAILCGFIFPAFTSLNLQYHSITYAAMVLDLMAFIDVYVRFHVCYYNEHGILVSHPLSTAKYYLTHGFIVDLSAAVPLHLIFHAEVVKNKRVRVTGMLEELFRMNKVLQLYRLPSCMVLFETNIARQTFLLNFFKFIPVTFIFINVLACLAIATTCTYWVSLISGRITVRYRENSWVADAQKKFPEIDMQNTMNLYLTAVYWMTTTSLCIGFGDIAVQNNREMMFVIMVIIAGYMIFTYMIVIVSSSKASVNRNLTLYQERMQHLISFMLRERVPTSIQDKSVTHFEYVWQRTHGIHASWILQKCHHALRQDAMLQLYEQTILVVPAFNGVESSFIRRLTLHVDVQYYQRGSPILKKNDIVNNVYIVHRGEVDIIGPDGTIFTKMSVGSVFGNIDNVPATRYMMTVIAAKHVDALVLPTETLHEIAKDYPMVKKRLQVYVLENVGYIPNRLKSEDTKGQERFNNPKRSRSRKAWFPVKYQKVKVGLLPMAYITSFLTVYLFTFREEIEWYLMSFLITMDVAMLVILFLDYSMEYYDDGGDIVNNIDTVRFRKRHEVQFILDFISIIPIELFSLISHRSWYWCKILRMNRLLRARHLYLFYTTDLQKLKVNMLANKLISMVSSFSLMMHVLACIWYLIACGLEPRNCHKSSWVVKANCTESYVCSIYFITTMVTTTGFGDIVSSRLVERMFCTCVALVMNLVIAVFMGDMSCIVQNYSYTLTNYDYQMAILKDYLKDGQISNPLVDRALRYVQSLWVLERGCRMPALLDEAPGALNEEIMVAAYGKHLFENIVFQDCHEDLLRQICGKMSRQLFFPTNFLVQEGDCNSTMYFIHRGTVEKLSSMDSSTYTVCGILEAPESFGLHQGFIPETRQNYTYRAGSIVEVLTLEYQDWEVMFVYYPAAKRHIYEKLEALKDLPREETNNTTQRIFV